MFYEAQLIAFGHDNLIPADGKISYLQLFGNLILKSNKDERTINTLSRTMLFFLLFNNRPS